MATKALETNYTLNEYEAKEILMTPRKLIKESHIFNDINLSREEKIKHAASILKSRR
ncbi:hypothetical protein [Lentibacillus sp. Marseille-P4043]|uniref:hypothetical protein n=1 Tax=Lentibacillus sp. Marseille-P4043 TaxID=2040293 RepID=UPI00131A5150|nr:hypothetical protein [Lentibacillus sp. Marseille-P4043]